MPKRNILYLILCIFLVSIITSACGSGSSGGGNSTEFIIVYPTPTPSPTPSKYPLELSKTEFKLHVGSTDNIIVTLNGEDITQTATYEVNQESIAIVEGGLITGLSVGVATVTVHAENAESEATFTVNVVDSALPSLVVDPSVISVNFDDELKVKVTLEGKDVTEDVSYTSDDDSIAIVDKGIVKGLKIGNTNVTVSLEGANSAVFIVNVNPFANRNVGDVVEFGHYPQSKVEGSDPPEYQVEPIKWRVLKRDDYNKKVLAVSVNGLYTHRFDETSNVWADSEIRSSLNGDDFYNGKFNDIPVFDEFEREIISLVRVENDVVYFGGDTHIFLLGTKDANNKRYFADDADRLCKPTDYAKSTEGSEDSIEGDYCYWWLRTAYSELTDNVYCVGFDGKIYFVSVQSYRCVRPALWVNL